MVTLATDQVCWDELAQLERPHGRGPAGVERSDSRRTDSPVPEGPGSTEIPPGGRTWHGSLSRHPDAAGAALPEESGPCGVLRWCWSPAQAGDGVT
jgi:hypothetical protein